MRQRVSVGLTPATTSSGSSDDHPPFSSCVTCTVFQNRRRVTSAPVGQDMSCTLGERKDKRDLRFVWVTAGPGRTSARVRFVLEKERMGSDARYTAGTTEAYLEGPADLTAPDRAVLKAVRADMSMMKQDIAG